MIAADSSTWVAFLQGGGGEDSQLLRKALQDRQALMVTQDGRAAGLVTRTDLLEALAS